MSKAITVKQALEIAINEEKKAYQLYMETSEKLTNLGSKQMLSELAQQELGHQKTLEKIITAEKYELLGKNIDQNRLGISEFLDSSELHAHANPQEVLIFAIKEEEKAINFYVEMKADFSGTELEKVFERLAAEERLHKQRLEMEYEDNILKEN